MSARRLSKAGVIASLGELAAQAGDLDGERLHSDADDLILAYLPDDVREAYKTVQAEAYFWAFA